MSWVFLGIAAVFEVVFAIGMKYSGGFTNIPVSIGTGIAVVGGIFFLSLAMKTLPVSVAYPIWTAVGVLGTVTLGAIFLGESLSLIKVISTVAIIVGVAGLKVSLT